jgi:hypothetical protein
MRLLQNGKQDLCQVTEAADMQLILLLHGPSATRKLYHHTKMAAISPAHLVPWLLFTAK